MQRLAQTLKALEAGTPASELRDTGQTHMLLSLPDPSALSLPPFAGSLRGHILVQETIGAQANVPVKPFQPFNSPGDPQPPA